MRKLFFANWKMYVSDADAEALAQLYVEHASAESAFETAIAPSFTALERAGGVVRGTAVGLGAQDVFWSDETAQTGEVSPKMLAELGVTYVIVGHSERRALGETDEIAARKVAAVSAHGMTPVLCVGETKEERETGAQERVVQDQLEKGLSSLPTDSALIVAYEPRWAIGTGVPCKPEDVVVMHALIRSKLGERGASTRILYGGSVDPSNVGSYLALSDVDGVLVGGASTRPDDVRGLFEAFSA